MRLGTFRYIVFWTLIDLHIVRIFHVNDRIAHTQHAEGNEKILSKPEK